MAGAWAGLVLAAALLWLAVPATGFHLNRLPGDAAMAAIHDDRPLTEDGYARAVASRRAALGWIEDHPRALADLALIDIKRAYKEGFDSLEARDRLRRAAKRLERALAEAPGDMVGWYHLAYAEAALERDLTLAARALAMSYKAGPFHPPFMARRATLGMILTPHLGEEALARLKADLRHLLHHRSRQARSMVRDLDAESYMRALFADEPAILARLEAILEADAAPPEPDRG